MLTRFTSFISKHLEKIVLILAITLSIASFVYYYHAGLITAYGDSRGHLNIARRVVDSLSPGAAQLGGYWLPLLHLLMLPTIWNDFMWQSGLSGAIPNMIAFIIAVVLMFRLILYITKDKFSAFIGTSVLLFNPNLLYMQATPMTESLFVMTTVGFMYFFYRWFQEKKVSDLILAALFLVLCSLNRYEGWGLVIAANTLMVWYWIQNKFDRKIEGAMFAFASLSFLGIFLWLLWGAVIFHDPLEFMHNALSAGTQTESLEQSQDWMGKGNLPKAIYTNIFAVLDTFGPFVVAMFIIGTIVYILRNAGSIIKPSNLVLFLLMAPFLFDVLTVYTGKVPIEVPEISNLQAPWNAFNIRYALYTLPAAAIFTVLISRRRVFQMMLLVGILVGYGFTLTGTRQSMIVLKDMGAKEDSESAINSISWFKENYTGGLILASTGGQDKRMFRTGIHQKNYITEGSNELWNTSLNSPGQYATWVIISNNNLRDSLFKLINKEELFKNFTIVNQNNDFLILKKNDY